MGKCLKEFEKWIRGQDQIPAYPRYGTTDEDSAAKDGWKAALEWILADLKAARDGFDLGIYDTLNKELGTENERVR